MGYKFNPINGILDLTGSSTGISSATVAGAYVPYVGALSNVTLGNKALYVGTGNAFAVNTSGNLTITQADPEIRLIDSGNSEYSRWTKSTTNYAYQYNRVVKPGNDGYAIRLNGTSQYVDITDHADFTVDAFSLETWLKVDGAANYGDIFVMKNAAGDAVEMHQHASLWKVWLNIAGVGAVTIVSDAAPTTNWTHYVFTRSTLGVMKMYIGGAAQISTGTNVGTINPDTVDIGFGYVYLDGDVDLFRFYNKELSAAEVTTLYNSGSGVTGGQPLGDTSCKMSLLFNDQADPTEDSSGNSHTGALQGSPSYVTGYVQLPASTVEATVWSSKDGVLAAEEGIQKFGHSAGRTIITGTTAYLVDSIASSLNVDGELTVVTNYIGFKTSHMGSTGTATILGISAAVATNAGFLTFILADGNSAFVPYFASASS